MAEADGSGLRLDGARWLADELRVAAVGADNASVEMLPFGDRTRPRLRIFLRRAGAQNRRCYRLELRPVAVI